MENTVVQPLSPPAIRMTQDVTEQILVRLPVSSLVRFHSVCKQWCRVISSPRFITEHARRAPEQLLLFLPRVDASAAGIRAVKPGQAMVFDEKWSPSTLASSSSSSSSMDADDHLFASCNGLLCFYGQHAVKVANPVTGDCLLVSKPDGILLHDFYYLYSFGFHPVSGEYKLTHFPREPRRYRSGRPFHFDAIQVHTIGDDKWRDIRAPVECCLVNLGVVHVDGAMYWLTEDEERRSSGSGSGMKIMSFDLKEETFSPIQPPPLLQDQAKHSHNNRKLTHYLSEMDGKVCLVTTPFHSHVPRGAATTQRSMAGWTSGSLKFRLNSLNMSGA
ncbi:putative F-box protein At1g32420 [Oryza brachyantha]|uniref:putative F-box protein At1g32420 n=1 Tax=Oryza brachyantha TaxID=4533 RepID=UPI0007769AC8|nr:putative F-box protein At1g32420 [Oryza brachyantha]XP_015696510.1 putative F-box protein At1g32420 [Oryza brachyantha]